jgi:hypothetical protein
MRTALALSFALLATGCFKMTIVNGDVQPAPAPVLEDKWRSSAVLDIVAIDVPLALDATCKGSTWAKIEQSHTFLDYVVDVFLAGWVYESTHATVWCAKAGTVQPPPTVTPAPKGPAALPPPAPPPGTPNQPPTGTPTQPPPTTL